MSKTVILNSVPDWLRWILILPASIVGYILVQFFIAILNSFAPGPDSLINWWSQFMNSIVGPACFVWLGAKVAPKYIFIVAVVLTVLFAITNSVLVTIAIMSHRYSYPLWWLITSSIIGIVVTIFICIHFNQKH